MTISINTNIAAQKAASQLSKSSQAQSSASERMTSGKKILKASDDTAGLAVSSKMISNKSLLGAGVANASGALALLGTAESALQEILTTVTRLQELASQATSGAYSDNDRKSINIEFVQLIEEVNRSAGSTNFNGIKLLDNSLSGSATVTTKVPDSSSDFQVTGSYNDSTVSDLSFGSGFTNASLLDKMPTVTAQYKGTGNGVLYQVKIGEKNYTFDDSTAHTTTGIELSYNGSATDKITLTVTAGAVSSQSDVDDKVSKINEALKTISIYQTRDVSSYKAQGKITVNADEIGDLTGSKFTFESNNFTNVKLEGFTASAPVTLAGKAELAVMINGKTFFAEVSSGVIGAGSTVEFVDKKSSEKLTFTNGSTAINITNASEAAAVTKKFSEALGLDKGSGLKFQVGLQASETLEVRISGATTDQLFVDSDGAIMDLSVDSSENATKAIEILQFASDSILTTIANVGALSSRMSSSVKLNESTITKLNDSISLFRDVDLALESIVLAEASALVQATISLLATANQQPQQLLKLFQ